MSGRADPMLPSPGRVPRRREVVVGFLCQKLSPPRVSVTYGSPKGPCRSSQVTQTLTLTFTLAFTFTLTKRPARIEVRDLLKKMATPGGGRVQPAGRKPASTPRARPPWPNYNDGPAPPSNVFWEAMVFFLTPELDPSLQERGRVGSSWLGPASSLRACPSRPPPPGIVKQITDWATLGHFFCKFHSRSCQGQPDDFGLVGFSTISI